jgi:hypothetical protein
MTTSTQTPVIDHDRQRACRLAHAFGAATAASLALLLMMAGLFRARLMPLPVLLVVAAVLAVAGGLAADLMARPQSVRLGDGWLAVSRLGRWQRVLTSHLVGLSANPHVAGSLVLRDAAGNRAEIDVRCLVRNPLIWQRLHRDVNHARRTGSLRLTGADHLFWQALIREAAEADNRTLTALDFDLPA